MKEKLVALICRHGSTELNEEDCFRSNIDVQLSPKGLSQAKVASLFLKKYPLKQIITSPMLRAFVTADIISKPHNLFVNQHRGLFPWQLGIFSGLSKKKNQEALRLFVRNPLIQIPNGESLQDFEDRSFAFFEAALKQAKNDGLTLYVCHTSNCVSLDNFTMGEGNPEPPEFADTVQPGGVAAIYFDGKNHRVEVIFGQEEAAKYGGS